MLDKDSALVVFSGGQDSTTCLYWAKRKFKKVYAITYIYGQKHANEVDQAREIAKHAGVDWKLVDVSFISSIISGCSLTDSSVEMDKDKPSDSPPNTFVPGRNLFFLSIAAVHARELGCMNLVTGVGQADYSGYPDCHDSFVRSLNVSLNLAMDEQFVIHTPLMWLDKSEIWALSDELGVYDLVREKTLTCYNGIIGNGCGECPACKLRRRGLEQFLMKKRRQEEEKTRR